MTRRVIAAAAPEGEAVMKATRVDPIFAAIDKHRKLIKECHHLYDVLDRAESRAKKKHGHRPWSLIAWRDYSAIGASEIDDRREEFLALPGIDPKKIEKEYRDAKARQRAAARAGWAWDKRAGIASLREQWERGRRAQRAADMRLAKMKAHTPAGAGALISYTLADMETGEAEWQMVALATAAEALASM